MKYKDTDGVSVEIDAITGPTIVNTIYGEQVGILGEFLVRPENSNPFFIDAETLASSFTPVD